ncbi:hypothetical protein LSH36_397g01035 [Paralvinella palmiformis]|uniref:GAF domain-containing protein n=1 Tax=Paralvinella palmiformis TaxID=53620 RepID=A0AAD9N074_9ANNE|nr:hypothetical protein LSH36_397g01035 [Paralvinella palmiformis]
MSLVRLHICIICHRHRRCNPLLYRDAPILTLPDLTPLTDTDNDPECRPLPRKSPSGYSYHVNDSVTDRLLRVEQHHPLPYTPIMDHTDVESWLESNPGWFQDYVLRKADTLTINKWLTSRGLPTIQDSLQPGPFRIESTSQDSSEQTSPDPRGCGEDHFFSDVRHQRSNSKKYLRHEFARAKMRSVFRTHEASFAQSRDQSSLAERRSSLKGMRQFLSLPPTSGSILSMLIQSKVRLPRYRSKDEELKRELRAANERDFFLEIVKDISHDLDLTSLTSRILVNVSILVDAEWSSLFFVEGQKGKQSLVSKVFDLCTGTSCLPTMRGDNIVRIPWGQGIIGHVAETGQSVNITDANQLIRHLTRAIIPVRILSVSGGLLDQK